MRKVRLRYFYRAVHLEQRAVFKPNIVALKVCQSDLRRPLRSRVLNLLNKYGECSNNLRKIALVILPGRDRELRLDDLLSH